MAEALLPHSPGGPVELCIGVCSAEYRTLSTQTYSFVVSLRWAQLAFLIASSVSFLGLKTENLVKNSGQNRRSNPFHG